MRLELDHVPGSRRLEQADGDGVERTAEVAAESGDAPLAPRLRIGVEHGRAGAAEITDEAVLLPLAGVEQPQHPPGKRRATDPAEVVPKGALALLADDRGAEVVAKAVIGLGDIGGVDRIERRRWWRRQRRHQEMPFASASRRALSTAACHAVSS